MDINRLQWFLRVFSLVPMTAVFAAMLPVEIMGRIHQSIGLGRMPEDPIVVYLARSTSLFYAVHGILLWYIASDLRRYGDFFRFYLRLSLLFAAGLLLTDISAGLPRHWVLAEGPAVAAFLLIIMWLLRRAEARDRAERS
jgi:hypothetical protein